MDEYEWLSCEDPQRMLTLSLAYLLSERRFRLIVYAIVPEMAENWEPARYPDDPALWLDGWIRGKSGQPDESQSYQRLCAVFREVVGNPWRPIILPPGPPVQCHICDGHGGELIPTYEPSSVRDHCGKPTQERRDVGNCRGGHWPRWCSVCWSTFLSEHTGYRINKPCTCCNGKKVIPGGCPWLTPTVVSLAQAAYDERATFWKTCHYCQGHSVGKLLKCPDCDNRGSVQVAANTLDPFRLALVADALLDAGCDEEDVLRHLRGQERCLRYDRTTMRCAAFCQYDKCELCNGTDWMPKRSPCVRGCHALDAILHLE